MKTMIAGCAKLIAGVLAVAVLGGAQCLNLCAISPCGNGSAARSPAPIEKSPCHHNRGSVPQPSDKSTSCSHQEFVAEKRSGVSLPEFSILQPVLVQPPHPALLAPSGLLTSEGSIVKVRRKLPTTSILRI